MAYYVMYRTKDRIISGMESLRTDSIEKARGKVVDEIGMDTEISGGIFKNKTDRRPIGYIFFNNGPFTHIWVADNIPYLVGSDGKIKRMY